MKPPEDTEPSAGSYTIGLCDECGAHVGHREVVVSEDSGAMPSRATRACSKGQSTVPRAEHERALSDLCIALEDATMAKGIAATLAEELRLAKMQVEVLSSDLRAIRDENYSLHGDMERIYHIARDS